MNIHKFTSILLGALLLISLNLQAKEVKNFYINGINNSEEDARDSSKELGDAFKEKYGHILVNTEVISIYNETQGALDLVESGMQATNLDKFLEGLTGLEILTASKAAEIAQKVSVNSSEKAFMKLLEINTLLIDNKSVFEPTDPFADIVVEESIDYIETSQIIEPLTGQGSTSQGSQNTLDEIHSVNQLARLLDLGMTATELASLSAIVGASDIFRDLAFARKEYRENFGYYASQEYQTQQKIRMKLDDVLDTGGAVNIIAHSQGNYFSYEAVTNINQPNSTRLLSVGSPLGVIPDTGKSINLREDMVVRLFNHNIGWNYSNIPDNTWNIISNNIPFPAILIANEFTLRSKNIDINNDKRGHNFINAYLKPASEVREAILDTIAKHYLEMGGNTVPRINSIQGSAVCENPLINLVGEIQALEYDMLFYGDKCLYFRDNYLSVLDLETHLIESTYDGTYYSPELEEYKVFRKFANNLAIVKDNSGLAAEFGLTLNSSGNVGCTVADNCVNGEITTAQQCENMFTALTGVSPNILNRNIIFDNNSCSFGNEVNKFIYNIYEGGINFVDIVDVVDFNFEDILQLVNIDTVNNYFSTSNGNICDNSFDFFGLNQYITDIDIVKLLDNPYFFREGNICVLYSKSTHDVLIYGWQMTGEGSENFTELLLAENSSKGKNIYDTIILYQSILDYLNIHYTDNDCSLASNYVTSKGLDNIFTNSYTCLIDFTGTTNKGGTGFRYYSEWFLTF